MNETMEKYIQYLKGAAFIELKRLIGTDHLQIVYFNSYEDFKKQKPDSIIIEKEFNDYFKSQNKIQELLVSEPTRLLREFPDLLVVTMQIKDKEVHVSRDKLEKYIGFDISKISVHDGTWVNNFVKKYIDNEDNRKAFFMHFLCSHSK